MRHLEIVDEHLKVSRPGVPFLKKWYDIRQKLYEYLLLDWGDFSAKGMLTKAIEESLMAGIIAIEDWILTDNELMVLLLKWGIGDFQHIGQIIHRLQLGSIYNPITLQSTLDTSQYKKISTIRFKRAFEKEFKKISRLRGDVVFHPILDNKKTNRSILYTDKESGEEALLGHDSKKLLIGIFTSVNQITESNSIAYEKICLDMLAERGVQNCTSISDPFIENSQLELPF